MKKIFYLLSMVVVSITTIMFASCSNEETITFPIDEELVGNYKGELTVNVEGADLGSKTQKITIEKADEKSINLLLKDFSFISFNIGDVELNNCLLSENGDNYSFTGTTSLNTDLLKADVNATGTIGGGKVEITMDIAADLGVVKQSVKVVYTGEKLNGTESSEAKITEYIFDSNVSEANSLVILQPAIDEETKTITFMVSETAENEQLTALVPTIEVSPKAIVTPGSGVAQDFSNGKSVEYTVEAEDGTTVVYNVSIKGFASSDSFGFEDWSYDTSSYPEEEHIHKVEPWASCNNAVALIKNMGALMGIVYEGEYPVRPTEDAYVGDKAVIIESVDTKGGTIWGQKIPKVTAGSIFLGTFNAMAAMTNPMATTSFGVIYTEQPVQVKGYYKYTPGAEFYNSDGELVEGKIDECSMSAVLYEITADDETLDGSNIYTSDKIVAQAIFKSSETVTEYTPFELNLEYVKDYDPAKKYKFTVILSASADGASYNAAVGSKLIVDEVTIVNKK